MDRKSQVAKLVEHAKNPLHKEVLGDADVAIPGGSPECGGSVTVYLKGDGNGGIRDISWTGQGDTISMGAASIAVERVREERLGPEEILALDYDAFVDSIGREVVGSRTRHATLGLSTIKAAVRKYQKDRRSGPGENDALRAS